MLQVKDLVVRYGGIQALNGVSLRVEPGELVALIGSNGAGKTSLLKAISGQVEASKGEILVGNQNINSLSVHKRVNLGLAHCPEARKIFSNQSILDNLLLGAFTRLQKEKKSDVQATVEEVFQIFPKLKERQNQVAGTLSGGEQQMLAIGRALMLKPKILLLDEPSMGLAPVIIDEVFTVIQRLKETRSTTILLVEQLAYRALQVADRGYVLEQGHIRLEGPASHLQNNPQVQAAYLGS